MEYWPCAFKQLWFHDMPFLFIPDSAVNSSALARRSHLTIRLFITDNILHLLVSRLCFGVAIRTYQINKEIVCSILSSRWVVSLRSKSRCPISSHRQKRNPPANLSSLPPELRLKIFDYVTNDASMKVVGYRQGARDAFYFKERGKLPRIPSRSTLQKRHFVRGAGRRLTKLIQVLVQSRLLANNSTRKPSRHTSTTSLSISNLPVQASSVVICQVSEQPGSELE